MKLLTVLTALLVLVSCAGHIATPAPLPTFAERRSEIAKRDIAWIADTIVIMRFEPFFYWGTIKMEMEVCSGRTRAGWPEFYVASISPLGRDHLGRHIAAWYDKRTQSILFALGSEVFTPYIRHELLHWLLEDLIPDAPPRETPDQTEARVHPAEYFGSSGRCSHLLYPQS